MIYRDFREWIAHLEQEGELVRVKREIHLEPDSGAIGRAILDIDGPAVLAENVYGYETKMATGLFASLRRVAMAMGLPKNASFKEQKEAIHRAYQRYPVKSKMVDRKDAPCKENIVTGDDVNLFQFPLARNNVHDAGPYIYKVCFITKDPDSDWVNCGVYRMQVLDRNKTSALAPPYQHAGEHYIKSKKRGKPLEIAVALGVEPAIHVATGSKLPRGWSEFDFAGAIRGEPEDLVMGESVEIPVPARAEIILEGTMGLNPNEVMEGPFGEGVGSYCGMFKLPLIEIKTITYRNDPIFDTLYIGRPPTESTISALPGFVAALEEDLKSHFPQITEVGFMYPAYMNLVIAGKWDHPGDPRNVIAAAWSSRAGILHKMVTVVDDDINVNDPADVMWAIATRCQANTDILMMPGCLSQLDPSPDLSGLSCRLGIDATKPIFPYRHQVATYITPREGTEEWKEELNKMWKGGKS